MKIYLHMKLWEYTKQRKFKTVILMVFLKVHTNINDK